MQILYEGADITRHAEVVEAVAYDHAGERADALCLTLQNAQKWYAWKPQRDDAIEVRQTGYTTGRMYLDTVHPEGARYRVIATSMPAAARQRRWQSYEQQTLRTILRGVAAETQMDSQVYGLEEQTRYPFHLRKNETGTAFLSRILRLEGAVLKCVGGKLTALGIASCQALTPQRRIEVSAATAGIRHTRTEGAGYAGARVITPQAFGMAKDAAATGGMFLTIQDAPALDAITAFRWARGVLLYENRKRETLELPMLFDPGVTAMLPLDIAGEEALAGAWLVERATHDFINKKTTCSLIRCVDSIR